MIPDHKVTVTGGTVFGVDQAGGRGEWSAGQLVEAETRDTVLVILGNRLDCLHETTALIHAKAWALYHDEEQDDEAL